MEESNDPRGDINVTSPLSLSWYKELTQIHGIHSTLEGKGGVTDHQPAQGTPAFNTKQRPDRQKIETMQKQTSLSTKETPGKAQQVKVLSNHYALNPHGEKEI